MLRPGTQPNRQPEPRRPLRQVGDNLDRLLGLLELARVEQAGRARGDRDDSYRALAGAIVSTPGPMARSA